MRLELCAWPEVEAYLQAQAGIIVPIGSTEQHGPTGLLGTDAICARTLARMAGEIAGAMVAPAINVGMSQHHLAFPGSMTLLPSTLLAVVRDCVLSLARHGFRRFFFINGHGGNLPTLRAAFSEIYAQTPEGPDGRDNLRCTAVNWWEAEPAAGLIKELFGEEEGAHATPGEISVAAFAFPDHQKPGPPLEAAPPYKELYGPLDVRRRYPDGRMGSNPSLASLEKGQRLARAAAEGLAGRYAAFVAEP